MSEIPTTPESKIDIQASVPQDTNAQEILPAGMEKLPPEMRTMVSMMAGFFRSTSGPDPETSKIVAQAEMHEESCKLDGFKESLKVRDQQNERDHEFRVKHLNHETGLNMLMMCIYIAGIICGLYLLVSKKNETVGSYILIAFSVALFGGKPNFHRDKK